MSKASRRNRADASGPVTLLKSSLLGLILLLGAGVLYLRSDRRVELDDSSYEMTVALYSVCNHRQESGLEKLEAMLAENGVSEDQESEGVRKIREIIAQARDGEWGEAKKACHQLLDQQTVR